LNNGTSGGDSKVTFGGDTTMVAKGGGGGDGSHVHVLSPSSTSYNSTKGAAGLASGGNTNTSGNSGGATAPETGVCPTANPFTVYAGVGGDAGNSSNSGGEAYSAACTDTTNTAGKSGGNGRAVGGGGGSGIGNAKGGNGANGRVKVSYTYYNVTLIGVSPLSGPATGGTTITLTGTELDDATAVTVGGKTCTSLKKIDSNTVECVTPSGTAGSTVAVAVTSHGLTVTKNNAFTYQSIPEINSVDVGVTPPTGSPPARFIGDNAKDSVITFDITGTNLADVTKVLLARGGVTITLDGQIPGGNPCTSTSTTIHCQVHTGSDYTLDPAAGVYSVTVVTAAGISSNTLSGGIELAAADFTPRVGLTPGGQTVGFSGADLGARIAASTYTVQLGAPGSWVDISASCTVTDPDELTCTMPAHVAETVTVWLQIDTGSLKDDIQWAYTYEIPIIELDLSDHSIDLSGAMGSLWADHLNVNVITNYTYGYHLDVSATEPRLACAAKSSYIEPLAGTGSFGGGNVNKWGWAKDGGSLTTPSSWTGLTTTLAQVDSFNQPTDPDSGRNTVLWFGTQVDLDRAACTYTGTVTITAVGEL
jgi:hypothetical protein